MWDIDQTPCGLCRLDGEGRILGANAALRELVGDGSAAQAGADFLDLLAPGARVYHQLVLWPMLTMRGQVREVALVLRNAQGAEVHVLFNATRRSHDGQTEVHCVLFPLDERKAKEDQLLDAQRTVEQLPGAVFRLLREPGGGYRLPYASPKLQQMMRGRAARYFDDAAGLFEAIHAADREQVTAAIRRSADTLKVRPITFRIATDDGRLRWLRVHCSVRREPDGTVMWQGSLYDVTQQQLIDERLREVDKLQAVATLAAGVAHDFNNVLGAIIGLGELCEQEAPEGSRARRNLGHILQAAGRASGLVRQLLDFSRQTPQQTEQLGVAALLQRCEPLLAASLPPHLRLSIHIDDEPLLHVDPVQIEQALHNLVSNAAYAMREAGGTIRILVDRAAPSAGDATTTPMARLQVIDHGEGMPADLQAKIFEPFFTTKPLGVGTGLGLSAVHGIVTGHGGHLTVHSQPGEGSVFTMLLPCADPHLHATTLEPTP